MSEYYPLVEGRALEYGITDAQGEGVLRAVFAGVAKHGDVQEARLTQTILRGGRAPQTFSYMACKDAKGVKTSAWGVEFKLPLKTALAWRRGAAGFRVESLDARKLVPAGDFKRCLELSFTIDGGDGGGGRRFYAPGVGLVYAVSSEEADPYEYALKKII